MVEPVAVSVVAAIALLGDLAKLGASPAVQGVIMAWLEKSGGISQQTLDIVIKAQAYVLPPKQDGS